METNAVLVVRREGDAADHLARRVYAILAGADVAAELYAERGKLVPQFDHAARHCFRFVVVPQEHPVGAHVWQRDGGGKYGSSAFCALDELGELLTRLAGRGIRPTKG